MWSALRRRLAPPSPTSLVPVTSPESNAESGEGSNSDEHFPWSTEIVSATLCRLALKLTTRD